MHMTARKHIKLGGTKSGVETWDSALMDRIPTADFAAIHADPAKLKGWLGQISRFGFGKLTNGPVEDLALMKVVDLFGYVRETNYGRHFEVRTEVNPTNLALYWGRAAGAYRQPLPRPGSDDSGSILPRKLGGRR